MSNGKEFGVVGSTSRDPFSNGEDKVGRTVFNGYPHTLQIGI